MIRWLASRLRGLLRPSGKQVIHLYCLCWNEERMLPFFFRHYDPLVDRYFVFDNGSTDRSLAMLAAHPNVTVESLETAEGSKIGAASAFYERVWHRSRGIAEWVVIVDIDEHLFHPDGRRYFDACAREGATIIPAVGYEMVSESFPAGDAVLSESIRTGVRQPHMDKLCVFRPDAIAKIGFEVGRHRANPRGRVVPPAATALKLLHYKFLSRPYVTERFAELGARIPAAERERGWARHYFQERAQIANTHQRLMAMAKPVEGL